MSSAGILPAMNGSAVELGNYDLEEGEILSGEISEILTSSPNICATEELFPYMDDKISYLLGQFQKIFGDSRDKEGSNKTFNQYGSFLVACPRQLSSLSQGTAREKHIPVAPTLNATRAKNSALALDGLRETNGPKGLPRNKPVPAAPTVAVSGERNNMCASNGLREEKTGPKNLFKYKTVPVSTTANVYRERSNTCASKGLKEKNNGPKDFLTYKPVNVAPAVNVSSEKNSAHISIGLRQKNGPKDLLKSKPVQVAPAVNVSTERSDICTSDMLKAKNNRPKGLFKDKPVLVALSVNVSTERNITCTCDGLKEKNNGPKGLVRDDSVPAAPIVSRERKSGLPGEVLRKKKIGPKSLVRDKHALVAPTINVSRKRISTFTSDRFREKKNGPNGLLREKHVPVAPAVNVCRERNSAYTSNGLMEKKNDPKSQKIQMKMKPDSPKDAYQILEQMLSPLPDSLLCLKESDRQIGKGLESKDTDASMSQKKTNSSPKESNTVKSNKLEDNAEKFSGGNPHETLALLPHKDKSLSVEETKNDLTDGINNSIAQDCVINDNWVCCDECQKWRLLPDQTDPNLLPKKWTCSMLNWLQGMNKCSFSEDETTQALRTLYKINGNKELKKESVIKMRPLKRKRQLIIDDDGIDEHSERQVFKALKPFFVEGKNNVESKFQKNPSKASEQHNFLEISGKEQTPPEQMTSDGKKRKINSLEADENNLRNAKKTKIACKGNEIGSSFESIPPLPQRKPSFETIGTKSRASRKNFSSGGNSKLIADSISGPDGKLKRIVKGKPQSSSHHR